MKDALKKIAKNVFEGEWVHKYETRNFCKVECIKEKYGDAVHDIAKRARDMRLPSCPVITPNLLPPAFRFGTIKLSQCLVGVMHTVVLNGGKVILSTLKDTLTGCGKWAEFYENVNNFLESIRGMSLSWLKCWTFGSPTTPGGGWLSENYLAFMTVSKSIACFAISLMPKRPEENFHKTQKLQQLIYCWNSLVTMILQPIEVTDRHVKNVEALSRIFLQYYAMLELSVYDNKIKNLQSSSCLVSLLTISEVMKLHGTQRNLWEGSLFGEGMFREVKPFVNRGLYTLGTAKNVMDRHYKRRELDRMISEIDINESSEVDTELADDSFNNSDDMRYRSFHSYSSIETFRQHLLDRKSVASLFCKELKQHFILVREGRSNRIIYKLNFARYMNLQGLTCSDCINIHHNPINIGSIDCYISCALIPIINTGINGHQRCHYYVINEERLEYNMQLKNFQYPKGVQF